MKKLKLTAFVFSIVFVVIQLILLFVFFNHPQHSDQITHLRLAMGAYNEGMMYPTMTNLYDSFIVAPGLINFLVLQLRIFGTVSYNGFFQMIMNVIMLWEVFYIANKLFSKTTGYIAIIVYCLTYSNYMGILVYGTEIPFLFLALSGVCLCLTEKWYYVLCAASCFSLSNTIRPLVILFVIVVFVYYIYCKVNWKLYVFLIVPFLLINYGYGKFNEARIGYFVNQSTTGGTNLLQTAHDRADGTTAKGSIIMFDPNSKYAYSNNKDKTVFEKDIMWRQAGIEWIKNNPTKYFMMFFKKIPYLYADDAWPERLVFDSGFSKSLDKVASVDKKNEMIILLLVKNIFYYIMLALFVFSLFVNRKDILSVKGTLLLLLILGTGATVLFPVMPRYHYPFMFVIMIWSAYGVEYLLKKISYEKADSCNCGSLL